MHTQKREGERSPGSKQGAMDGSESLKYRGSGVRSKVAGHLSSSKTGLAAPQPQPGYPQLLLWETPPLSRALSKFYHLSKLNPIPASRSESPVSHWCPLNNWHSLWTALGIACPHLSCKHFVRAFLVSFLRIVAFHCKRDRIAQLFRAWDFCLRQSGI